MSIFIKKSEDMHFVLHMFCKFHLSNQEKLTQDLLNHYTGSTPI